MKKVSDVFLYVLACVIVVGFLTILGLFVFKAVPEQNNQALSIMLGTLGTAFGLVVGYFFGSSKGSADKTELMINNKPA